MFIAPLEQVWAEPAAIEADLAALERSLGARLPEPFRQFCQRFDGGYPYPNLFEAAHLVGRVADPMMYVEFFYSLAEMQAHWRGETYGAGCPPDFIIIGNEPGGVEILLSLRAQDHGVVYLWQGSTNIWGSDGNDERALFAQAGSFDAFLAQLCDTPDAAGHAHWNSPRHRALARDFALPLG